MATAPDQLTLKHHRDLEGRERRPSCAGILCRLLGLFFLLGLAERLRAAAATATAAAAGAELEVYSPERVRSGLFFESRFTIRADREIEARRSCSTRAGSRG